MLKKIENNNWNRVLKIIIPYILIVGSFQLMSFFILNIPVSPEIIFEKTSSQKLVVSFFTGIGTYITVWTFRKYIDQASVASLGFSFFYKKDFYIGLLFGFLIIGSGFLSLLIFQSLSYMKSQFLVIDFCLSFGIFILVALTEELIIRGYVLNNLMSSINKWSALFLSSIIFSIMHLANPNINLLSFINIFLAGILLGLPYIYTKNLWFSIAFHFSWNFFQGTIFGFAVSGLNGYSLIVQKPIGNTIWNGGSFGFEGSILCILFQVICILILYFIFRNREPTNGTKRELSFQKRS